MSYQSYSTYVPEEGSQSIYQTPMIRDTAEVTRVTVTNGNVSADTSDRASSAKSSELSPFAQEDWRSTAIKAHNGFPATEITEDTVVTLGSTQGRVKDFVYAGLLQETANGFELVGSASTPDNDNEGAESHSDSAEMPGEIASAVDAALEPFSDSVLDTGLSLALSSVTGEIDMSNVIRSVSMRSGMEPGDVQQRVQFAIDAHQAQADSYVTRQGISKEDLGDFWEFSRQNRQELRAAINAHAYERNLSGYRALINKFQSHAAPSIQALQGAGFQTRTLGREAEVRIQGVWMTAKAAAKAGLI